MQTSSLPDILESILFAAPHPLTFDRLCSLLEEYDRGDVREALSVVRSRYRGGDRGLLLDEVAGGWQFRSNPRYGEYVRRLFRSRGGRLGRSSLETLAIIAYRQPVTRAEIEYLRGVDSGGVLKNLLDKRLIKILGKKDVPGKPLIYGTTREFLSLFGLKDLGSLPTLRDIQELAPPESDQVPLPLENIEDGDTLGPPIEMNGG
ncbi:MAG: SMC-Scp complex subunit ScpB [Desulfuromonadia bacterium]